MDYEQQLIDRVALALVAALKVKTAYTETYTAHYQLDQVMIQLCQAHDPLYLWALRHITYYRTPILIAAEHRADAIIKSGI